MATNAVFVAAMQALAITGVTRHYDEPPGSVQTADLPCAFPHMPQGGLGEKSLSCWDSNKVRSMDFVILIEPVGQGTQAQNYGAIAALMDNLEAKLDDLELSQGGTLANFLEYDIGAQIVTLGQNDYWGIVANVRARDV